MPSILIGGDLCPIGRNQSLFEQGNATSLLNDLLPEFESADLSIVNLECPLIRDESPIKKCGPVLGAPTTCVNGLKAAGINVFNLANNHIMDHGAQGLRTTIDALQENSIAYFGAGKDLNEARDIWIREIRGIRIGVLGLAEHEFGIAERSKPGANPLDVIDFVRNVHQHRSKFDYLIVLVHGGNEFYQYPRPKLIDTCRFLVEQGAGAVVCQQSHCVGSMEIYRGAPILYGQGNFIFDYPSKAVTWHEGVLATLVVNADGRTQVELIPYVQSDEQPGARRIPPELEEQFLCDFNERSKSAEDESFVLAQWEGFCQDSKRYHLHLLNHPPSLFRRLLGRLDLLHYLDSSEKQRMRLHVLRCESIREVLITLLSEESGK